MQLKDEKGFQKIFTFHNGVECWAKQLANQDLVQYVYKDESGKVLTSIQVQTKENLALFSKMKETFY